MEEINRLISIDNLKRFEENIDSPPREAFSIKFEKEE